MELELEQYQGVEEEAPVILEQYNEFADEESARDTFGFKDSVRPSTLSSRSGGIGSESFQTKRSGIGAESFYENSKGTNTLGNTK